MADREYGYDDFELHAVKFDKHEKPRKGRRLRKARNGFKYDIESMDLTEYKGQITADHVDMISYVIGEALGLAKRETAPAKREAGRVYL